LALAEVAESAPRSAVDAHARPSGRAGLRRWAFLGVVPFIAYITIFLLIPTGELIVNAFRDTHGHFTWSNVDQAIHGQNLAAFGFSMQVSALSAAMGGVLGFLVANAVLHDGIPRFLRPVLVSFSGVASNFAGVPLAFAYTATLGTTGLVTSLIGHVGLHVTPLFLTNLLGLSLVYLYFQFPLMILLVLPSIEGLKKEWREAAANLGASSFTFWARVGLPVLAPSLLGMMVLLFGNAFSAYATAYALGSTGLVTTTIGLLINGNLTLNPQLAYALAFGMIVIIAVTVSLYTLLQRRASRWLG